MTQTFITLTEDEFDDQFPLLSNHLNRTASWVIGDAGGCLFETYGEELAFIQRQAADCIWTLLDGEDGDLYVVSGCHFINRLGYLISHNPVPEGVTIEVHIPMESDEDAPSP